MIRALGGIVSGNLTAAIVMMLRTLLVSRLIALEDFGIASTFLLALALIEMVSALGFQQQIMQANDGNDPSFQAALHGLSVLRGGINAGIVFALALPMAWFFNIPQTVWAFQLIALVPLLSGFVHLDPQRLSRRMENRAAIMLAFFPPVGSLVAVWPLARLFGDYRVMLFAIMVQIGLTVLVSHLVAQRRYQLRYDPAVIRRSLRFGWPLMVSGGLMFLVFNGERAIIGKAAGLEALALFSMALSLTLTPALVIARSTTTFFLPQLAAARATKNHASLAIVTLQSHLLLGCVMAVSVALGGGPFLGAVLGDKYAGAVTFLCWLSVLQAFRVFESGCAIVALAAHQTKNEMMANLVRVALLPVAWVVLAHGGDVTTLIQIGIAGEMAGFAIGLASVLYRQHIAIRPLLAPLGVALALLATICTTSGQNPDWQTALVLLGMLAAMAFVLPDLHRYLRHHTVVGHLEKG